MAFPVAQETGECQAKHLYIDEDSPSLNSTMGIMAISSTYKGYRGNGGKSAGWPNKDKWDTYSELWNANLNSMRKPCGWNGLGAGNSNTEINNINKAINKLNKETGIDSRFILAIMMQESKGCVRVRTTSNSVRNPGLMQSHNGKGTCVGINPCAASMIELMIRDSVTSTKSSDGLKQCFTKTLKKLNDKGSQAFYAAARMYNSGSLNYNDLNKPFTAIKCYDQDVANRLTGWTTSASKCI